MQPQGPHGNYSAQSYQSRPYPHTQISTTTRKRRLKKHSQQQNNIRPARLPQRLHNQPRPTRHIRPPVSPDLRLVAYPAQGYALERPVERLGDGLPQGGFAGARGADEAVWVGALVRSGGGGRGRTEE